MMVREVSLITSLNWLSLVCFIYSSLALQSPDQSCHPTDLSTLKEFVGNLTNRSIISGWSSEPNCCRWDGVVCEDVGASRVVNLILTGKGLKGVVSVSLVRLDLLKFLDLSYNHIEGGWPRDLSNLQQLENNSKIPLCTGGVPQLFQEQWIRMKANVS